MADFDEGFCGCFTDLKSCLASLIPGGLCLLQAVAADLALGGGKAFPFMFPCLTLCVGAAYNRGKIREKYRIQGNFAKDMLLEFVCPNCAITQEYREVHRREG